MCSLKLNEIESESYIKEAELFLSSRDLAGLIQDITAKGNLFRLKVKGFSMSPFIKDSDVVTISPLSNSAIGFGKSVAFIHPETGRLVIHRIVGKSRNGYLIKGDDAVQIDGSISEKNILGYVTKVERNSKKVFLGFGPERILIAFLSRWSLLFPLLIFLRKFVRPIIKRFKDE